MENILLDLIRYFCPYLQAMAAKTADPVDDLIVKIICRITGAGNEEEQEGGNEA